MKRIVKMTEESMRVMEAGIPELAGSAVRRAYYQALTTGGKVTDAIDGQLVETSADGTQRVIRSLPARVPVVLGSKRTRTRSR